MSGYGFQDLGVALVVVAALGYLGWRRRRAARLPGPACEDCPHAEAHALPEPRKSLIQIDSTRREPTRR